MVNGILLFNKREKKNWFSISGVNNTKCNEGVIDGIRYWSGRTSASSSVAKCEYSCIDDIVEYISVCVIVNKYCCHNYHRDISWSHS